MESENDRKLKKTRRGKKCGRRSRGRSWSDDCGECALNILSDPLSSNSILHQQNETDQLDLTRVKFHSPYNVNEQSLKGKNRRYIRPRYSPKAPHNSTQFIMEDHECEYSGVQALSEYPEVVEEFYSCRDADESKKNVSSILYSPKRMSGGSESNGSTNSDLELDVENLQIDNTFVFMANDFENCYHNARTEELSELSRDNLIEKIIGMENKVMELEHKLSKINKMSHKQNLNQRTTSHSIKSEFMSDLVQQLQSLKQEKCLLKQMKIDAGI